MTKKKPRARTAGAAVILPRALEAGAGRDQVSSSLVGFAVLFRMLAQKTEPLTAAERGDLNALAQACDELVAQIDTESDRREYGDPETRQ